MRGDSIIVEEHHRKAAGKIVDEVLPVITGSGAKYVLSVGGESGSGKSEVAAALAGALKQNSVTSVILQQDDYFLYPPKTNDRARRNDLTWVGPQEVRLDILDQNLMDIKGGSVEIEKPLVIYEEDRIIAEKINTGTIQVVIVEGTYTTLLKNVDIRVFINRNYHDTREHRIRRKRAESELDDFVERVLTIEHEIITRHKDLANFIITREYDVVAA